MFAKNPKIVREQSAKSSRTILKEFANNLKRVRELFLESLGAFEKIA